MLWPEAGRERWGGPSAAAPQARPAEVKLCRLWLGNPGTAPPPRRGMAGLAGCAAAAERLVQGWARAARPSAPRQVGKRRGAGERDRVASGRRPWRGDLADTLCQCCCSGMAFGAHQARGSGARRRRRLGFDGFPDSCITWAVLLCLPFVSNVIGTTPPSKVSRRCSQATTPSAQAQFGFWRLFRPRLISDTTRRVPSLLRPRTFVPSLHTSYLIWNQCHILPPLRAVLFSHWWLLGASPSLA